jgi:hypothetical protein
VTLPLGAFAGQLSRAELEAWAHGDRSIPEDVAAWRAAHAAEIAAQLEAGRELARAMEAIRLQPEPEPEPEVA